VPTEHTWPAAQAAPHAPQLVSLVCSFTHAPPQFVSPGWQVAAQVPTEHTWLTRHVVPQAPQLP
jgi:hypothetical protein